MGYVHIGDWTHLCGQLPVLYRTGTGKQRAVGTSRRLVVT